MNHHGASSPVVRPLVTHAGVMTDGGGGHHRRPAGWRRRAVCLGLLAVLPWQAACTHLAPAVETAPVTPVSSPVPHARAAAPESVTHGGLRPPAPLAGAAVQTAGPSAAAGMATAAHAAMNTPASAAGVSTAGVLSSVPTPGAAGRAAGTTQAASPPVVVQPVSAMPGLGAQRLSRPAAMTPATVESITLAVGQAHLLDVGTVRRVAVGNGRVLQVNALDQRQLLLLPEAAGESTLHLWLAEGVLRRYRIQVTESDSPRVAEEINQLLGPDSGLRARPMGDKVVLEGEHPSEEGAWRAAEIVKRYPQVINLASRRGFEQMVNLEVKMIEVGRNAMQQLGVRWFSGAGEWAVNGPSFGVLGDFKRSADFLPLGDAQQHGFAVAPRIGPFASVASLATSISSAIDLMLQNGEAVLLAEPRLSARSGGKARFVAGGELPIPMLSSNGVPSIDFKEYGVRFEVEPSVNVQGIISARLHTEVSSINGDVSVSGVPGLRKQSADADVNLRAGETLVIAGMVTSEMSGAVQKLPGLGNLPVIGNLFKSRRFRNRETEMVVLITPRLAPSAGDLHDERSDALQARAAALQQSFGAMLE